VVEKATSPQKKVEFNHTTAFTVLNGMEKWLSGRKRFFAKEVNLKRVPRVRIPPSPPVFIDICPDLPIIIGKSKIKYGKSSIQNYEVHEPMGS
jgi:hypothetical protein